MTKEKDLKRLVRARMAKTGESYTAARAHLVSTKPLPLPDDYEKIAGMSDDAARTATGMTWPEWAHLLDDAGAAEMEHRDIVTWIVEEFPEVSGWWAQMTTVGYERLRGLRDVGQRRGGGYDANKSKTVPVTVEALFAAVADPGLRAAWLPHLDLEITTANRPKSIRCRLGDGTRVAFYFTAKSDDKSSVALQHSRLPDKRAADATKKFWGERLGALHALLVEG